MKKVVTKAQVAHLWANQSQPEATTQSRNFYFEGAKIWSYGSHFLAAMHLDGAVLITTDNYSVTTQGHIRAIHNATSHLTCFNVPVVDCRSKADHKYNLAELKKEYEQIVLKASRARTNAPYLLEKAESQLKHANDYATYFKLGVRLKPANVEMIKERAKKQAAKAKKAELKRQKELEIANRERCKNWREGSYNANLWNLPVMCRLSQDGFEVQTSHGARFPTDDAIAGMGFVLAKMERLSNGESWRKNGEQVKLGHFQIDSITNKGIVAGCHKVAKTEIIRLNNLIIESTTNSANQVA